MVKFELESEQSSLHSKSHLQPQSQSGSESPSSSSNSELNSELDSEMETFACSSVAAAAGKGRGRGKGKIINKSREEEESYFAASTSSSSFYRGVEEVDEEEEEEEEEKRLAELEGKFAKLGVKFRRAMNFYGLAQDVTLLMSQKFHLKSAKFNHTNEMGMENETRREIDSSLEKNDCKSHLKRSEYKRAYEFLCKLTSFSLVLLANLTGIYVLVSHFIWEFKVLDAKSNSYSELVKESASSKGWSVLKEFLENLRRHLSRIFAVSLTLTWHLNCHNMEKIFVDCAKYYSMFCRDYLKQEEENFNSMKVVNYMHNQSIDSKSFKKVLREKRKQLLEIGENFYKFSKRRINWSIWLPMIHFCFNVSSISLFPSSNKRRARTKTVASKSIAKNLISDSVQNISTNTSSVSIFDQILDNFDSFHLSIHTAFHPYEYNVTKSRPEFFDGMKLKKQTLNEQQQQQIVQQNAPHLHSTVTPAESAIYCLLELLIYSVYYHGPRIICATCLAIILNMHYQCISFFNRQLQACIKRPREKPLTSLDIINLVKQYDLIGRMHEKIEHTFKWSIVQWYVLMFISCLMHIFAFTESTSAYVVNQQLHLQAMANAAAAGARGASSASSRLQQQQASYNYYNNLTSIPGNWTQQSLLSASGSSSGSVVSGAGGLTSNNHTSTPLSSGGSTSFTIMFVRLASVFFVCYSPYLIYCEAFRIEAASNRAEQSVQKLVRRQDDPLAQAIEPSLFEPNYLSVGDYFHISKKSMSSLLGAIVTFSVMFIG